MARSMPFPGACLWTRCIGRKPVEPRLYCAASPNGIQGNRRVLTEAGGARAGIPAVIWLPPRPEGQSARRVLPRGKPPGRQVGWRTQGRSHPEEIHEGVAEDRAIPLVPSITEPSGKMSGATPWSALGPAELGSLGEERWRLIDRSLQ